MDADDCGATVGRQQPVDVVAVIHKHILSEAGGTLGALQDREVSLLVAVSVGEVGADLPSGGELSLSCVIETVGKLIALSLADRGPGLPSAGVHPCTIPGGVAMDRHEADVFRAESVAPCVDAVAAFPERDVAVFGDDLKSVVSLLLKLSDYFSCDLAAITVFPETIVRRALSGGILPVSVVN